MKVEITQVRKVIVDIGKNDGTDIDDLVLDKYNNLKDSDFNPLHTEMYYKALPLEANDLDVKYRIMDIAHWIIKYFYDKYGCGPKLYELNVIMYFIYEYYLYDEGIKFFDADFVSYRNYPNSLQMWKRWCTCVSSPIFMHSQQTIIKINDEDKENISKIIEKYKSIDFFHIHDIMKDTLYEKMVCAGEIDKKIIF